MRALLLPALAIGMGLAACGGPEPTLREQEEARANELATIGTWDRMFGAPDQTIAFVNQFGYRAPEYGPVEAGVAFGTTGSDSPLTNTAAAEPNSTGFFARGSNAGRIDALVFTLKITDPEYAESAKERFGDILTGFFDQYDVDATTAVREGLAEEDGATRALEGAVLTFDREPIEGGAEDARRLTVTISRNGATAPATQEPEAQGTQDGNRR